MESAATIMGKLRACCAPPLRCLLERGPGGEVGRKPQAVKSACDLWRMLQLASRPFARNGLRRNGFRRYDYGEPPRALCSPSPLFAGEGAGG